MIRLPAASESRLLRLWLFTILYFIQGIPSGLFLISLPGWLAQHDLDKGRIGAFIAIVTMPWAFKFVFAPLMDKLHYLKMGRRRPWVLGTQVGILASTLLMAFVPDPIANLDQVALYGFLVNLFSSIQDLAVDGMSVDLLPRDEQARAQSWMIGGQAIGKTAASAGGGLVLFAWGYPIFVLLTAVIAGLGMLFPLLVRERPGESLLPWTSGRPAPESMHLRIDRWRTLIGELFIAFAVPTSLLVVLALFVHRLPVGITRTIYPVIMVQQVGWTDAEYSQLLGFATFASAAIAMTAGAPLVHALGRIRTIYVSLGAATLVLLASGWYTGFWRHPWFMASSAVLVEILIILSNVAFYSVCMQLCRKNVAATQFALYMALNNLGVTAGAWLTDALGGVLSSIGLFYLSAGFCLAAIGVVAIPTVNPRGQAAPAEPVASG